MLVELPLFRWDARFFPKAWLLLLLFFYGGWHFLRQIGRVRLGATVLAAAAIGSADALMRLPAYRREPPQSNPHVAVDGASLYSSAPVFGSNGWMYEAMGRERYVLRRLAATKIQTFAFDGDAFHPAQSQREGPVFLELVHNGVSEIERFDPKTYSLNPASGSGLNATEPAVSPDGGKLAFVADGGLYLAAGGRRTILAPGRWRTRHSSRMEIGSRWSEERQADAPSRRFRHPAERYEPWSRAGTASSQPSRRMGSGRHLPVRRPARLGFGCAI